VEVNGCDWRRAVESAVAEGIFPNEGGWVLLRRCCLETRACRV